MGDDFSITNSIFLANNLTTLEQRDGVNVLILYSNCLGLSQLSIDSCQFLNGHSNLEKDIGTLTVEVNCTGVNVEITNSNFTGPRGANLYVNFMALTKLSDNFVSNGSSGVGPAGVHIALDENLPDYDPLSCGYGSTHQPHHLIEISDMIMTRSGAFYIEDNVNPEIECNVQYVSMRNSVISQCSSTKDRASVFFSARDQFRTIRATFENVSIIWCPFWQIPGCNVTQASIECDFHQLYI